MLTAYPAEDLQRLLVDLCILGRAFAAVFDLWGSLVTPFLQLMISFLLRSNVDSVLLARRQGQQNTVFDGFVMMTASANSIMLYMSWIFQPYGSGVG